MNEEIVRLRYFNLKFTFGADTSCALLVDTLGFKEGPGVHLPGGRENIEAYWKIAIDSGGVRDVSVETIDARSSGAFGYEISYCQLLKSLVLFQKPSN